MKLYLSSYGLGNHPESEAIESTVEYFKEHNMAYKTLHDGQAIVINGHQEEITPL